jgi:hypothetical protein
MVGKVYSRTYINGNISKDILPKSPNVSNTSIGNSFPFNESSPSKRFSIIKVKDILAFTQERTGNNWTNYNNYRHFKRNSFDAKTESNNSVNSMHEAKKNSCFVKSKRSIHPLNKLISD